MLSPAPDFPLHELLDELDSTFQAPVAWNWRDPDGSHGAEQQDPVPGWPPEDQMDYWASEGLRRHPLVRWFTATGDLTANTMARVPRTVAPQFAYDDVRDRLRPFSLEQQLSIPYRLDGDMYRAFVVAKSGRDFHPEQLSLARFIQPLLVLLDRQCTVLGGAEGDAVGDGPPVTASSLGLTGREVAVLRLLAEGGTATAIGHRLHISPRTVQVHLNHLYRKLGVNDRLLAVSVARNMGLLAPLGSASVPPARDGAREGTHVIENQDGRVIQWPTPVRID